MEIRIIGEPKEIAALVMETQRRTYSQKSFTEIISEKAEEWNMKEQIESIAVKYALLMEKRLDKALADGEKDISDMEQVDEGIKMLGYGGGDG